jgi:5'-nucleotidase
MAVSLNAREGFLFDEATRSVIDVVELIRNDSLSSSTFLNVNIPNIPYGEVRGFMVTSLGKRIYNGSIIKRRDPSGGAYYWIGGDSEGFEAIAGTDLHAVDSGYLSVTPLHWDLTSYSSLEELGRIFVRR